MPNERFAGLVGAAGTGWRTELGWRGDGSLTIYPGAERGTRTGYRPGQSGGWRQPRTGESRSSGGARGTPGGPRRASADEPFLSGGLADRGPLERSAVGEQPPEPRAREARELERQRAWRDEAARALTDLRAEEGTGPVNANDIEADGEAVADRVRADAVAEDGEALRIAEDVATALPTLRVVAQGISRKRLEQAIRELQLPVIVSHDLDDADVVMTLRSEYRQKTPLLREAEERAMPIYVLKNNTVLQMQASLTSIFSLEVDPRDAAIRETEEAIGLVVSQSEPVELAPQNAYIRRLQHQMAERANLVSRSRGREPYRRVRLYPDAARTAWR
jgi:hypothetical protein